jgi:hypothetical protein
VRNAPHRFEILRRDVVDTTDGVPEYAYVPLGVTVGWFGLLDTEELDAWQGQRVTASARIPHGFALTTTDRVRVITPADESAAGAWEIATIRFAAAHLRVMLRRTQA